jgi:hypothetical protein
MEQLAEQKTNFLQKSGFSLQFLSVLLLSLIIWAVIYPHQTPKTQASGITSSKQTKTIVASAKVPTPKAKDTIPTATQITSAPQVSANTIDTNSPVENKPTITLVITPILEPTKVPDADEKLAIVSNSVNQILTLKVIQQQADGFAKGKKK